jgi:hypothetical protein
MKREIMLSASLALSALLSLNACSGNSSTGDANTSATGGTGHYVDSNISGVNYACGTYKGTTGADGEFTFEIGKGCKFSVGNITLRNVSGADLNTTKATIIENNITVAQFLQNLDNDGDASNGITVSANMLKAFKKNKLSNMLNIKHIYNNVIANTEGYKGHFISEKDAKSHLAKTIKTMLRGKTFYAVTEPGGTFLGKSVITNDTGYIIPFSFNNDLTMVNEGTSDAAPIKLDGNTLTFSSDPSNYLLFETKTEKYIRSTVVYVAGSGTRGYMRFYYHRSDAQSYADTIKTDDKTGSKTGSKTEGYTIVNNIPDKADGLIIYNHISSDGADEAAYEIHTANNDYNRLYNSNKDLSCSDYGFSYLISSGNIKGIVSKMYSTDKMMTNICIEEDHSHASDSGDKVVALFKK